MLLSASFQDAVTDGLCHWIATTNVKKTAMFKQVCDRTDSMTGMKRLLVDAVAVGWSGQVFSSMQHSAVSSKYLADTVLRLRELHRIGPTNKKPWQDAGCTYHDHGDENPCYKTLF